jgi:hypothetical protein
MEAGERDSTDDWAIPTGGTFLLGELEAKVDQAVAIARASEEGVREVGEMALDAARQARRAAEMAEAASVAALEVRSSPSSPVSSSSSSSAQAQALQPVPEPLGGEARLRRFTERCDRVSARLRALERRPGAPAGASGAEARRRGDG